MLQLDNKYIQGTPEWLEMRRSMVMASDSPIIMGVSKWKSIFDLYDEKVLGKTQETTFVMKRGIERESEARDLFETLTGHFVSPKVKIDEVDPWLGASCDGWNDSGILVEIKCAGNEDHSIALKGGVPNHYFPQLQHLMWVFKVDEIAYFSYNPSHEHVSALVWVKRDDEYLKRWYVKAKEFYKCIVNQTPPASTSIEDLKKSAQETVYMFDSNFKQLEDRLAHLTILMKEMEEEANAIKQNIIKLAKEKNVQGSAIRLYKRVSKGSIDYSNIPALKDLDLEIYRKNPRISWHLELL